MPAEAEHRTLSNQGSYEPVSELSCEPDLLARMHCMFMLLGISSFRLFLPVIKLHQICPTSAFSCHEINGLECDPPFEATAQSPHIQHVFNRAFDIGRPHGKSNPYAEQLMHRGPCRPAEFVRDALLDCLS